MRRVETLLLPGQKYDAGFLVVVQSFSQFNISPKWIREERDRNSETFDLTIGSIEGHTHALETPAKCFQTINLETDMVKAPTLGPLRSLGRI